MTLRDLINKLLGRQPASAATAKQRLQLVRPRPQRSEP